MSHTQLVEEAKSAIHKVTNDMSVSREKILDSIEELEDELDLARQVIEDEVHEEED